MTDDWYPCSGGHVGFTHLALGARFCTRCDEVIDWTRCEHDMARGLCIRRHVDPIRASLVGQAKIYGADHRVGSLS